MTIKRTPALLAAYNYVWEVDPMTGAREQAGELVESFGCHWIS
jgi:hypothetical protein